ncbi:hypothetical protein LCGC14_1387920 [marine sediment metagenome]|uniref:Uncharacterized protein n=1 Tax=marine sediment metagenome TaxID=412755 RepID=A0A0F9KLK7_9ZZZZ
MQLRSIIIDKKKEKRKRWIKWIGGSIGWMILIGIGYMVFK